MGLKFLVGLYRDTKSWIGYILGTNIAVSGKSIEEVIDKLKNILSGYQYEIENTELPNNIDIISNIEL